MQERRKYTAGILFGVAALLNAALIGMDFHDHSPAYRIALHSALAVLFTVSALLFLREGRRA